MRRTFLAGLLGGAALNATMFLTFRLLGFGWNADGILLDPAVQSPKLIAVWTTMEPLPLIVTRPAPIVAGLTAFGLLHALIYRSIARAWPAGTIPRALRFAALLFATFFFWEFFTPFNQLGEPALLIALELFFWAIVALSESLTIVFAMEGDSP